MVDLNGANVVTIGLISVMMWLGFQWALAFMGWSMPA